MPAGVEEVVEALDAPAAARPPELAIVVVNFGSHELVRANLGPVALPPGVEVIVVDNYSSVAERSAIARVCAQHGWELLRPPTNLGFGAAVNLAAERAREDGASGLLLLNPDAAASAEVIEALRRQLAEHPDVAVTPRIHTSSGRVEFRGSQVQLSSGRIRSISPTLGDDGATVRVDGQVPGRLRGPVQGWLSGACLAIGLDLWRRAGGMAADYFLYWEDVELSRRIERAGGQLVVRNDLSAVHDEGSTHGAAGSRSRSQTYYYYNCRNRLRFAARNLSRRDRLRWLLRTPVESWQILLRGGRRQLLRSPRPLLAATRGSLAGVGTVLRSLVRGSPQSGEGPASTRPVLVAHPGAALYGSDRMLLETVHGLLSGGRPVVVVLPGDGPLVAELRARGASVAFCRMPVLRKRALRPRGFVELLRDAVMGLWPAVRLVRDCGTGGVYVNTLTIPSWLVLSRLLGRHVVCHVHEAERSASPRMRRLLAAPVLCADRVVVNSEFCLEALADSLPGLRARSSIVYNGIRGPSVATAARGTLADPARVLYVGRLSPRKGPHVALAAVAQLVSRGLDVRLDLLGDTFPGYEWFTDELYESAAALGGRITFLGFDPDVWPHLSAADIVVIPSLLDEGFGNAAVEALLAARPAVVSATSGLREAADGFDAVVQVAPDDPTALADAIERIVAEWPAFAAAAHTDAARAAERYSPARYRAEVAEVVIGAGRAA